MIKAVPIVVVKVLVNHCVRRIVEASGGAVTEAEARKDIKDVLKDAIGTFEVALKRELNHGGRGSLDG